jgi:UDP-glucose 4-epimerase
VNKKLCILIIGSKGFIGSHAIKFLTDTMGHECWGCDVVVDYNDKRYFLLDSTNSDYGDVFKAIAFDVCINCSGAASVSASLENPYRDYVLNTVNVFKILEAIHKESNTCKFLNISSAAVYGNPVKIPVTEEQPLKPLSPYGLHKMQAEEICREFSMYYGLKTCSARVFSAYGTGLQKQIFWDVYQKAKQSKTVTLFGNGSETRDFIFVDDLVNALYLITINSPFNGECINVANGTDIKISQAVELLLAAIHWQGEVIFDGQVRKGDPINWKADIRILSSFNYNQKFSLAQGLEKYVQWLNEGK